jgi:cell division protein FtsI/penicillin-binding protein 2
VQAAGNGGIGNAPWAAAAAGARPPARRLFSAATAEKLRAAFADAVRLGTAREAGAVLRGAPWSLGGKTATVVNADGTTDGWFAGLVGDADGRPRRVVVVWLRAAGPGGIAPARLAARLARAVGG